MTIKEVMGAATGVQRGNVISAIVRDGFSATTAYSFCNGTRRPRAFYMDRLCAILRKYAGYTGTPGELYPDN
ncbi:MAG: hypothetical protein IJS66_04660 [Bacteroidales bacterium]|nr:hypothetical protein [Bacteroidales bacterium]